MANLPDTNAPSPATPWYSQPLPPQYDFGTDGFAALAEYVRQQPSANGSTYSVAPIVACYSNLKQRRIAIVGALPMDRPQYEAGRAVGSATGYYPAGTGGVGLITSPYANAAVSSTSASNEWHTVGILRHGDTVWIHNPAYAPPPSDVSEAERLPMVPGMSNVSRLLNSTGFGAIRYIFIQGPDVPVQESMECMGRSAQWVDNVIQAATATHPFLPGHFQPGQAPLGYYPLRRH